MSDIDLLKCLVITNAWIQKWDKYLIAQRSLTDRNMPWYRSMVGWKLEWVTWPNCLQINVQREIKEEVWIEVENLKIIWNNIEQKPKWNVLYITFLCQRKSGEAQPLEDMEQIKRLTKEEIFAFDQPNLFELRKTYLL